MKVVVQMPGKSPEVKDISGDVDSIYEAIDVSMITSYCPPSLRNLGLIAYVDDNGLVNGSPALFYCKEFQQPICGGILITKLTDDGEEDTLGEHEIEKAKEWLNTRLKVFGLL